MTIPSWITKTLKFVRNFFLWILFGLSMLFFSVGTYFYQQVDEESEFGLNGDKATAYVKDHAAARAMAKLVRSAEKNSIPVYQFKGPYFDEHLGLDFPTYTVCFKHPTHYFCYDDWTNTTYTGFHKRTNGYYEWLESQPD